MSPESSNSALPTLAGWGVTLRPLSLADAPTLFAVTPRETFRYFLSEPAGWTLDAFTTWMGAQLLRRDQAAFLVLAQAGGSPLGSTSLMDIQPAHRHVEIGCTWYTPSSRGTLVNPACKLLLLTHAFEQMFDGHGAARVTLKCDARNLHSQAAIAKLGAQREGTLRRHRIRPDGFVRDTVYFSILPEEWPAVREGLERRLASTTPT